MVLGFGALGVYLTILSHVPEAALAEVPMLLAAGRLSPVVALLYTIALLAAIYTTAVSALFGFVNRILGARTRHFRTAAVAAAVTSVLAGRVGFSSLVATLFPAVGYAGLVLLGALALGFLRGRI